MKVKVTAHFFSFAAAAAAAADSFRVLFFGVFEWVRARARSRPIQIHDAIEM